MKSPLHVLHLEDDPNDAELIRAILEGDGISCVIHRVETRCDFLTALDQGDVDLILSDFTLPAFDGLSAAKIVKEQYPDIPLILVSGTLGEEKAIESLQGGATDYVLKERLARLPPAVRRAMKGVEDQAAKKRLEAQIIEAQKMELLGQLASGVAHDFNNILAVIIGNSDLLQAAIGPDSSLRAYSQEITHASELAAGLTRQLLVFSRKQKVTPVALDLNTVTKDLEKLLRQLITENIEMTMVYSPIITLIKADAGYVGQLLMNLVVNARDAMPDGGKLMVATGLVSLDVDSALAHGGVAPGDYAVLSVSDTGTGISSEVKSHMFDAFFTTKPLGKGTGLGLATCQNIAQQLGAHIDCCSDLGKGAAFHVYFPCIDQQATS